MLAPMHASERLITDFYTAFQKLDADGMAACYADDVAFSDPAFPDLRGDRARGMWRMLCKRAKDFELTFSDVTGDDAGGSAKWEARYLFSATGRKVHNVIDARFEIADGKIVRHVDTFDFWRWTRMALGPAGLLLGWTPMLKAKVQREAASNLDKFLAKG